MTFTNHAVAGALVAAAINYPPVSIPAALLSHFVLDVIPHWKYCPPVQYKKFILAMDTNIALMILLILALTVPASRKLIIIGGLIGPLPDLMWLPEGLKNKDVPMDRRTLLHYLRRFHFWIQWKDSNTWGLYVEAAWFVLMLVLVYQIHPLK
jgi:hypothetical protein